MIAGFSEVVSSSSCLYPAGVFRDLRRGPRIDSIILLSIHGLFSKEFLNEI